ncbi:MAG: hypothetical protein BWY61_02142 [Firmicutes bacterium ADurb.Bin354]|nr:MAG: hypothetical protein BWY61_02142 [Firmicutes bacterium ADurb.Bin354]
MHADAIVVLMGSFPERVLQAVDLYHEGKAGHLLIVYESMGPYQVLKLRGADIIRTTEQVRDAAIDLGVPADRITMLPGEARSTLDEAVAVREYIRGSHDIDTLLLVSSPTHMRRAYMIFRKVLRSSEKPVFVGTCPSSYSSFSPDKWWRQKEDVQSVVSEMVKILSFLSIERREYRE